MYLLFPGRHQLLTNFQFEYLKNIIQSPKGIRSLDGSPLPDDLTIDAIIFAVTSANHSNTRRNPVPFYLRALAIQEFSRQLGVPTYIYGVDDVGELHNFASYTLKRVKHESEGVFDLTPHKTLVLCSTPVLTMYEQLGFRILPAELQDRRTWRYETALPWDIVERIASNKNWQEDKKIIVKVHPSSVDLWKKYKLGEKVALLFTDRMIGDDGDITSTRDYNVYVRQMDDIAELKYTETQPYINPGRIGDIGCAVGSWIRLACKDDRLRESDFYGVEVARPLFDICTQRKHNGEFANPFVFFSQRNAVTGLVFEPNSMDTIHTSSLTHEIESYGSRKDLLQFVRNRYRELASGGVWINRDVIGPEDKDSMVLMKLNKSDGRNADYAEVITDRQKLREYLNGLSTHARFLRFALDFRASEGYTLLYRSVTIDNEEYIQLSLKDASEFMSRKDYTDNWQSEMHETFCFWDFNEWKNAVEETGFKVSPESRAYTNEWIVENRLKGKVELYTRKNSILSPLDYPVTNMILLAYSQ